MGARTSRRLAACLSASAACCALACSEANSRGDGPRSGTPPGLFEDRAAELGLDFAFDRAAEGAYFMPDNVAAGCAFLDFDQDGRLDVYVVNGYRAAGADMETLAHEAGANRLYRQGEDGGFTDVTAGSGAGHTGYGMGVAVGDYDSDGFHDLYISCYGPDALLHNEGDGTFRDVTAAVGLGDSRWGSSAGFLDYDADGRLDLFVVNYLDFPVDMRSNDLAGRPEFPGPSCCDGVADILYHNEGERFRDVSASAGIAAAEGKGLGLACVDIDGDGQLDVFVANDSEPNRAWIQSEPGVFVDRAADLGLAFNKYGAAEAGMGVAAADFDGDLRLDLFVTNLGQETNTLYVGEESGRYRDRTAEAGLAAPSVDLTGFGTDVLDVDLDGDLDVACVGGRVLRGLVADDARLGEHWAPYAERGLLLLQEDGRFRDASAECGALCNTVEVSRGLAIGDYDNDGDPDVLVSTSNGSLHLFENTRERSAPPPRWVGVRALTQGRDALGAVLLLETSERVTRRELICASSYLSSRDPRVRFGLAGSATPIALEVRWPDGTRERFEDMQPGEYNVVEQGEGARLREDE